MYQIVRTKHFERALRKLRRSGKFKATAEASLDEAVELLAAGKTLPASYFDHQLQGVASNYRECHIKGDTLLVYELRNDILVLVLIEIGSHSELFG